MGGLEEEGIVFLILGSRVIGIGHMEKSFSYKGVKEFPGDIAYSSYVY